MLCNNQLDIAIADQGTEFEDVTELNIPTIVDTHAVVCSVSHPLATKPDVSIGDVSEESWVLPNQSALPRRQFEEIFASSGLIPPIVSIETHSPSTIKAVTAETALLGWLPSPMVQTEINAGVLAELGVKELQARRELKAFGRKRSFITPQIRFFAKALASTDPK